MVNFAKDAIFIIQMFFAALTADPKLAFVDQKIG